MFLARNRCRFFLSFGVSNASGSLALSDPVHMEILRQGPRAWNAWRLENPDQIPDFDDAAFSLGERQLGPAHGGPVNLRGAQIRRAFLRTACLTGADLEGADLSDSNLAAARLDHANLTGARLAYAVLDHANFAGAILAGANLVGASLRGAQGLTQAQINGATCDLTTNFPEHLVHPISTLAARSNDGVPLPCEQASSKFFSPLVHR